MSSDRRVMPGLGRVTTPGYGALRDRNQRRWSNFDQIIEGLCGSGIIAAHLRVPPDMRKEGLEDRYLLVGSMANTEIPCIRTADDDTQIEMFSTQLAHPVKVFNLDNGKQISLLL